MQLAAFARPSREHFTLLLLTGDYTQNPLTGVNERNGDVTSVIRAAVPIRYNLCSLHSWGNAVTNRELCDPRTVEFNSSIQQGAR